MESLSAPLRHEQRKEEKQGRRSLPQEAAAASAGRSPFLEVAFGAALIALDGDVSDGLVNEVLPREGLQVQGASGEEGQAPFCR